MPHAHPRPAQKLASPLLFEQVDNLSLGTPTGVRVHLQSRRHVRMSKLCLCNLQWSPLRMQQRAIRDGEYAN